MSYYFNMLSGKTDKIQIMAYNLLLVSLNNSAFFHELNWNILKIIAY